MAARRVSDARAAVDRSFEQLYRGHQADVFRAALRELGNVHDAEDVTQAAFVDAYRAVLGGSQPQAPRAWLLAIAENVRRRRFRTAQRRPREEPIDADFPLAAEIPHELAHTLAEALADLPPEQRQVFVLRELAGLSYDEIAEEVGSTVGAIQMLLFRARRSLRERLEPPAVARRRAGILLPLPGWLTGLVSRADVAVFTPRAAGAVGATVAALVGASVAVNETQADGSPAPVVEQQSQAAQAARQVGVVRIPGPRAPAASVSSARAAPAATLVARQVATPSLEAESGSTPTPTPTMTPTVTPTATATPAQASVPTATAAVETSRGIVTTIATPEPVPAPELPRLPVLGEGEKVEELVEPPAPPLSTAPVLEAAAGAVSAAGAGAPPLPVPGVPPVALPPAP
jgi:RNA polymerase sigma-70 factor (ECF subfamily)